MKRTTKLWAVLLLAVVLLTGSLFAGCANKGEGKALSGSMTFVIAESQEKMSEATVFSVDLSDFTDQNTVADVIYQLAKEEKICYQGTMGAYGLYMTAIGILEQNGDQKKETYLLTEDLGAKRSLYYYTTVEADQNDGDYKMTLTYEGRELVDSINSVSRMALEDGAVVCVTYTFW